MKLPVFIITNNYHKGQEAEEIKSQTSQTRLKPFYPELYFNLNMEKQYWSFCDCIFYL